MDSFCLDECRPKNPSLQYHTMSPIKLKPARRKQQNNSGKHWMNWTQLNWKNNSNSRRKGFPKLVQHVENQWPFVHLICTFFYLMYQSLFIYFIYLYVVRGCSFRPCNCTTLAAHQNLISKCLAQFYPETVWKFKGVPVRESPYLKQPTISFITAQFMASGNPNFQTNYTYQ